MMLVMMCLRKTMMKHDDGVEPDEMYSIGLFAFFLVIVFDCICGFVDACVLIRWHCTIVFFFLHDTYQVT